MALNAAQEWWVRTGGSELNGGGYDATVSGAGTNYADQDAAQLSLTDFACLNTTTLTSVTGGFTALMVGNIIRIASGTHFTPGYYMVTGYTDTNTVTLDSNPTDGSNASGGVGRLGGAHANLINYANGGNGTQPVIATPLAPGHKVHYRCSTSTDDPSVADWTADGYYTFPSGDNTNGFISFVGYNGRPLIESKGALVATHVYLAWKNLSVKAVAGDFGVIFQNPSTCIFENNIIDQNGIDMYALNVNAGSQVLGNWFRNTGSFSAGSQPAIVCGNYASRIVGNMFDSWQGPAISSGVLDSVFMRNIIVNIGATSAAILLNGNFVNDAVVMNNTIANCAGDAIRITQVVAAMGSPIRSNIIYGNGGYGLNYQAGAALSNGLADYNAFGSNTSGPYSGVSAGDHDVTLTGDPFTDAAGGDFSLNNTAGAGAACRGVAFPHTFPA